MPLGSWCLRQALNISRGWGDEKMMAMMMMMMMSDWKTAVCPVEGTRENTEQPKA